MDIQEVNKSVETALASFNELKGMVEGFGKKLGDITPKMDAFDQVKFDRMANDIANAIEHSQKEAASRKALEDQVKQMETAFNRAPGATENKGSELKTRRNELFNQFARTDAENKINFAQFMKNAVTDATEFKALSGGVDPSGGYTVMPEFGGVIQTKVYESSPIRALADVTTIGTDSLEVILDNDEAASGWVSETGTRSDTTTPTLGKLDIPVHEMYAQPKATQKLLDDSIIDIEAWLSGKVAEKFARDEATAFVSGNGVGKPRGILSYSAGTDISLQQIEQIATLSASTVTYDGLVDIQNALKEPYQPNATWLFRRASNTHLLKIKDGEGRPIFNMTYDKNAGLEPTILGAPVRFAADMPAIQAAALALAYGDFRQAYQVVDRIGIRILRDPYTDKPYVKFYTTRRVGGAVKNFEAIKLGKIAAS